MRHLFWLLSLAGMITFAVIMKRGADAAEAELQAYRNGLAEVHHEQKVDYIRCRRLVLEDDKGDEVIQMAAYGSVRGIWLKGANKHQWASIYSTPDQGTVIGIGHTPDGKTFKGYQIAFALDPDGKLIIQFADAAGRLHNLDGAALLRLAAKE